MRGTQLTTGLAIYVLQHRIDKTAVEGVQAIEVSDPKRACSGYRRWDCGGFDSQVHGDTQKGQGVEDYTALRFALQEGSTDGPSTPSISEHPDTQGDDDYAGKTGPAG
ncbi:unnamed protein product [Phytophthora lilii]|uniref:Unnamed protein product n=1 Tax=Phytophthora lilii TaxID=2077276 RepID=A0A9W6WMW2_9STRA|nr:unnamed protein product [Phytophthora lilii]